MANKYSVDLLATAIGRVQSGEPADVVAREMCPGSYESFRVRIRQEMAKQRAVITPAQATIDLREKATAYVAEALDTLSAHMRLYRDPEWIAQAGPATTIDATRTVGQRLVAVLDRLPGGSGPSGPDADA